MLAPPGPPENRRNQGERMSQEQSANPALGQLTQWLRQRHTQVMQAEAQALQYLDANDTPGHNAAMRQKAELLASMADDAKPMLEFLSGELRFNVALALENFSASARTALRLDSIFYMGALLYPDDHRKGEPDNLILCIERMEKEGADFRQS